MRMRVLGVLLLLLPGAAQGQSVRGVVLEDSTRAPIAGATVELLGADSVLRGSVVTDSAGWFRLDTEGGGRFLLRPSHPSYAASGLDTVTVEKREIVTVELRMGRAAIPLEPLLVTARAQDRLAGFRERSRRPGFGRMIQREEIDGRPGASVTDLLLIQPGLRIVPVRRGRSSFTTNFVMMNGASGPCPANIFLDGMPIRQLEGSGIDDIVTTADGLEGAEIYPRGVGVPPEFMTPMNGCGVVALWTRESDGGRPFSWKRLGIAAALGGLLYLLAR